MQWVMIARHWTGIVALNFQAIGYEVFATLSKTKNDMSETKGMMQKKIILFQAACHNYTKPGTLNTVSETVTLKCLALALQVMENIQQDTRVSISGCNQVRN